MNNIINFITMKKPIFKQSDRRNLLYPELEIAKMKFKRYFDKTWCAKLNYKILDWISIQLLNYK